jgi:hypothetical protein
MKFCKVELNFILISCKIVLTFGAAQAVMEKYIQKRI